MYIRTLKVHSSHFLLQVKIQVICSTSTCTLYGLTTYIIRWIRPYSSIQNTIPNNADIRCTQFVIKFKSKLRNLLLRPMGQLTYPRSLCHQLELYYSNDDSKSFYYICLCYVHHGLSVGHSLDKLLRKPPPQGGGSTPPTWHISTN